MLLGHTPRTGRRPPRSTPLSERLPFERRREGTNVPNHPTLLPTDHDRSTPFSFSATSRFLPPTRRLFWSRLRSPHRYLLRFLNPSLSFSCTSRLSSFYFLLRFSTLARALALCCSCNHLFQHRSSLTPFYLYFVVFIFFPFVLVLALTMALSKSTREPLRNVNSQSRSQIGTDIRSSQRRMFILSGEFFDSRRILTRLTLLSVFVPFPSPDFFHGFLLPLDLFRLQETHPLNGVTPLSFRARLLPLDLTRGHGYGAWNPPNPRLFQSVGVVFSTLPASLPPAANQIFRGRSIFFAQPRSSTDRPAGGHPQLVLASMEIARRLGGTIASRVERADWIVVGTRKGKTYAYVSLPLRSRRVVWISS